MRLLTEIIYWQPIRQFLAVADAHFGPMTTIHLDGLPDIYIPWNQFHEEEWECLHQIHTMLQVNCFPFRASLTIHVNYFRMLYLSCEKPQRSNPTTPRTETRTAMVEID